MDQVEVEGLRIAYERAGNGPVVALGHGFVGTALSTWASQIDALSRDFTVIAWDVPGAGESSDPPGSFRIADYADCWASFLQALGFSRAHMVGLSFGGIVALSLVARHPTMPSSLALLGSYAGWRGSLTEAGATTRLEYCLRVSGLPPDAFARAMVPSMFSSAAAGPAVDAFAVSVGEFRPAGFRTMARASAEADLRPLLPDVRVPTLLLYGEHDERAPLEVAEGIRAGIPSSQLVVLPGVGHVVSVEAADAVNRVLVDFLRADMAQT